MTTMEQKKSPELDEDPDEYLLDSVRGNIGAKKKMAILNKTKLSSAELHDLLNGEDNEEV